ncbi:hypothetical protein CAEBREN_16030 [Caenorhabditis brenneri]|uniref:Uncharacterized protein n=1 Tax=Caenorhabditis brenneri TaxID=135651 RepID=G0NSP1_CAEBE|nr:hypothetical protein CAEBREN_16030 [Caenorhabditis brenneri]
MDQVDIVVFTALLRMFLVVFVLLIVAGREDLPVFRQYIYSQDYYLRKSTYSSWTKKCPKLVKNEDAGFVMMVRYGRQRKMCEVDG